jgi:hypothetical protein
MRMNTRKYTNKELSIALTVIATISVLFVAPNAVTNQVFALGHWHEGDDVNNNSDYEDQIKDCLNAVSSGSNKEDNKDQITDCFNTVDSSEEDEKDNDNDAITTASEDDHKGIASLNSVGEISPDMEDSTQSDDVNEDNELDEDR